MAPGFRRRVTALLLLGLGLTCAAASSAAGPDDPAVPAVIDGREVLWADEFSGRAGGAAGAGWTSATGGGGWGNAELQCYTTSPRNAATDGQGHLVITAEPDDGHLCADGHRNSFTSARLTTEGSFSVTHGRLEVRARLPGGAGAWPAFWALGADLPEVGWPHAGEIDVLEFTGNRPTVTTSAVHLAGHDGAHWYSQLTSRPSATLTTRFHVYAVEWSEDALRFYRDSEVIGGVTRAEVERHGPWPFDRPFFLLLNLAMGGTYAGPVPPGTTTPQQLVVDYVRVLR